MQLFNHEESDMLRRIVIVIISVGLVLVAGICMLWLFKMLIGVSEVTGFGVWGTVGITAVAAGLAAYILFRRMNGGKVTPASPATPRSPNKNSSMPHPPLPKELLPNPPKPVEADLPVAPRLGSERQPPPLPADLAHIAETAALEAEIRRLIEQRRYDEAEQRLTLLPGERRDGPFGKNMRFLIERGRTRA